MALNAVQGRQWPIHLIVDWDGTLTKKDTMSILAGIGYTAQKDQGASLPPWSDFGNAYMRDFEHHELSYRPWKAERYSLAQERAYLASLQDVEVASVIRVQESGLFRGVSRRLIRRAASEALLGEALQLRPGWLELLADTLSGGAERSPSSPPTNEYSSTVSILSVNWSRQFIKSGLEVAADHYVGAKSNAKFDQAKRNFISYLQTNMLIEANEIEGVDGESEDSTSTGRLVRAPGHDIRTSADKLSRIPHRCQQNLELEHRVPPSPWESLVAYIGDSTTDLECLMAADIGICMRDEPMGSSQRELAETLERLGVAVHDAQDHAAIPQVGGLYWARDFGEVKTLLEQLRQRQ